MTDTSGPPAGAILFEIVLLGLFVIGIRASYRHWRRGPDLLNSTRYGAVAMALCCAAVGVWTVAFVNLGANRAAVWVGFAVLTLAAPFAVAGRIFVLAERRESNRDRQELGFSGRRRLFLLFAVVWVGWLVILVGGFLVVGVAFIYGGRTVDSGFDDGASQTVLAWVAAMMLVGGWIYLIQRRAKRREDQRLRAEERGESLRPRWLAPPWAIGVLWVFLTAAFCLIAGTVMLIAGHGASETRLASGLDGLGYGVVGVVASASGVAGVAHWRWQSSRHGGRQDDGGL